MEFHVSTIKIHSSCPFSSSYNHLFHHQSKHCSGRQCFNTSGTSTAHGRHLLHFLQPPKRPSLNSRLLPKRKTNSIQTCTCFLLVSSRCCYFRTNSTMCKACRLPCISQRSQLGIHPLPRQPQLHYRTRKRTSNLLLLVRRLKR